MFERRVGTWNDARGRSKQDEEREGCEPQHASSKKPRTRKNGKNSCNGKHAARISKVIFERLRVWKNEETQVGEYDARLSQQISERTDLLGDAGPDSALIHVCQQDQRARCKEQNHTEQDRTHEGGCFSLRERVVRR